MESMAEWSIDAAIVAEPYFVHPQSNWAGDTEGDVAVVVPASCDTLPLVLKERGLGYVAVTWGKIVVVGHISPQTVPWSNSNSTCRDWKG